MTYSTKASLTAFFTGIFLCLAIGWQILSSYENQANSLKRQFEQAQQLAGKPISVGGMFAGEWKEINGDDYQAKDLHFFRRKGTDEVVGVFSLKTLPEIIVSNDGKIYDQTGHEVK